MRIRVAKGIFTTSTRGETRLLTIRRAVARYEKWLRRHGREI